MDRPAVTDEMVRIAVDASKAKAREMLAECGFKNPEPEREGRNRFVNEPMRAALEAVLTHR
ncbi:MAG: hypothetical protein GEU92_19000 [Alphaproteobacteria bacterium]|nr:hypothetical protein [Alphaproteobacteria bacterium]